MKPYLLTSDIHFHAWDQFSTVEECGTNSRLGILLDEFLKAYKFAADTYDTKRAFCAGDIFHQRGKIAPSVLNPVNDCFSTIKREFKIETRVIPGNHDLETNEACGIGDMTRAIRDIEVASYTVPTFTNLEDGNRVIMIPWQATTEQLLAQMRRITASRIDLNKADLIIHAPLDGVLRGVPSHGLTPKVLLDACPARRIFCGHYHNHIGFDDRVYSIGALTHQTWGDIGTKAGYLMVFEDRVEHFETDAPKFIDITDEDPDDVPELVRGNYVRTTLDDPTNDDVAMVRSALTSYGAAGVLVKAIQTKSMTSRRVAVGASIERIDESVNRYAEEKGGPPLAKLCDGILKNVMGGVWSS